MKQKKTYPTTIIIFGAKGDLTRRKLVPALYNLFLGNHLPALSRIVCLDYITVNENEFKDDLLQGVNEFSRSGKVDTAQWNTFASCLQYIQGDFLKEETFTRLKEQLDAFDRLNKQRGIRLFYYAVAPRFIETIAEGLYKQNICNRDSLDRMVIEKPFGTDLQGAQKLNRSLLKRFAEKQVYRIDHYMGKETVQNIMAFRFANHVFEPLWNKNFISHVQITVAEQVSVGLRGGYYEGTGAIRDMIQNHLLQLLCVTAMECPLRYDSEMIRDAKVKVMKNIRVYKEAEVFKSVVRAQYKDGLIANAPQNAYRKEEHVDSSSNTETFVAAKFFIDNERWKGVPFFLVTGKCMPRQSSVIAVQFKDSPNKIFRDDIVPNRLIISIQPELEISLLFESKVPGLQMKLKPVEMDFTYKESYKEAVPEAYEALLLDALHGDATLFMRADQVEAAWKVVMPILNAWKQYPSKQLHLYKAGTWGPAAAKELLKPYSKNFFFLPEATVK